MRWACPVPFGASFEDVLYICPDKRSSPIVKEVWGTGNVILTGCAEGDLWQTSKSLYKQFTGAEASVGAAVWSFYLQCVALPCPCTFEELKPSLVQYNAECELWRAPLRPGALHDIEVMICDRLRLMYSEDITNHNIRCPNGAIRPRIDGAGRDAGYPFGFGPRSCILH